MSTRPPKQSTSAQGKAFIDAAREAGADVDTYAADRLMGRLAKTPVAPKRVSKPKSKSAGQDKI